MLKSTMILDPKKREDVWRYLTYQFLHAGFPHIFGNLLMQLFLGIPLELVHGTIRVGIVYTGGVMVGGLTASIVDPNRFLLGCSGGGILKHLSGLKIRNESFFLDPQFFFCQMEHLRW